MARADAAGNSIAIERAVLIEEIRRHLDFCIEGLEQDRNKRVFWLYYRVGLSAGAIADLPGIGLTTKGVESLILRVTKALRERISTSNRDVRPNATSTGEGVLSSESL
jgi:RNA polymerase sigma-70 factor (ECF subfamily)